MAFNGSPQLMHQAGLAPWLRQATGGIIPPQQPALTGAAPAAPWYAEALAQQQSQAISPEIVQQMLMAQKLRRAQEAAIRNKPIERSSGLFGKFGVDPISRKAGIEPEELGQGVGQTAVGMGLF
jgi:hypothetical protein